MHPSFTLDRASLRTYAAAAFTARSAVRSAALASAAGLVGALLSAAAATPELLKAIPHASTLLARGMPTMLGVMGMFAYALSAHAARRCRPSHSGWFPSLPFRGRDLRRGTWIGLSLAQAPVWLLVILMLGLSALVRHVGPAPVVLVALPLEFAGAAIAAGSGIGSHGIRRGIILVAAIGAIGLAAAGTALALIASGLLLVACDAVAADAQRAPRPPRRRTNVAWHTHLTPRALPVLVVWRALGATVVSAALPAIVLFAGTTLVVRNNELEGLAAARAVACGVSLAVSACLASLATSLVARRQASQWLRALPQSSARRVGLDAVALAIPGAVLALAAMAVSPVGGLLALAFVPFVACVAVAANRRGVKKPSSATSETMMWGWTTSIVIAIWPMLWLALPPLLAGAFVVACRRDRAARSSRWLAMHHDLAGDPMWMTR
jgi:hypothetical protein